MMKKLNNKGYMLVEIILAFSIAFGLLYFIMNLVINIKEKNDDLLVKTLVTTDQTIAMNGLMEYAKEEKGKFDCSKITSSGNTILYNNQPISVVSDYAKVILDRDKGYSCSTSDGEIKIKIPVEVKQMSQNFDIIVNYKYAEMNNYDTCSDDNIKVDLADGMLPVVIKDDGTLVIADPDNEPEEGEPKWYDYCGEKRWANVVLINNDNRLKYFDTNGKMIEGLIGTEIPMNNNGYYKYSHVLAHFVYVPRYSYKIWNTNPYAYDNYIYKVEHSDGVLSDEVKTELDSKINEKTIDIIFHTKDVSFTSINEGDYKTMPAFMFDGNDLNGIWIGKFELTGTTTTPTVKPNLGTLRSQNLRNLFSKSLLFSGRDLNSSNSVVKKKNISDYGLKFAQVNSHMIKNSEWGAIAYLAHSLYGINGEIRINNYYYSNAPLTGCGASSASAASATTCAIPYGTPSAEENMYPQSTTGNISGIFDMSGGSREFVGGYFKNNTGKTDAGTLKNSSGFGETFNFETLNEYFDSYEIIDFDGTVINNKPNNVILNESILLSGGHAMFETAWWYEDFYDIDQGQFFIERGGYHSGGSLFYMTDNSGASNNAYSSRVVLAVTNLD